jgi:DNA-binding Xre family transcriptional regulator
MIQTNATKSATLGLRIAAIRRDRRMTKIMLAANAGTSRFVIHNIERGSTRRVDLDLLGRIAVALCCTVEDLQTPGNAPMPRCRFRGSNNNFSRVTLVPVFMEGD